MTWTYNQSTGSLIHGGKLIGIGYSGAGQGRNNHLMEAVKNVGPIPTGAYSIGKAYKHPTKGPVVMNLDPIGHNALGRTVFRIHGDNVSHTASEGCIILQRKYRELIAKDIDKTLHVVSGLVSKAIHETHYLNSFHSGHIIA